MFYGSVAFIGNHSDLHKVACLVEDETILTDLVSEISEPIDIELDSPAILFNVEFNNDQWIDLNSLHTEVQTSANVEIVHVLTDGATFIEIISTNPDYDDYEDTDIDKLEDMARLYNIRFGAALGELENPDEEDLLDEDDEEDEYDNWD